MRVGSSAAGNASIVIDVVRGHDAADIAVLLSSWN